MMKQRRQSNVDHDGDSGNGGDSNIDGNGDGDGDDNDAAAAADGNDVNDDNGGIQGWQLDNSNRTMTMGQ